MNEFIVIDVMNEAMIETLKSKNENCDLNLKIKEALKDEALFFKIDKKNAYEILKKVGVKQEQLENVYKKLISENAYRTLLDRGKIKENDESIQIKYNVTDYNNLFKKKNI